jgi:hypothetical protein
MSYGNDPSIEMLVDQLSHAVNGSRMDMDEFANQLANEHPTLLGQIAKAVGLAVMRRALYDQSYRSYDDYVNTCQANLRGRGRHPVHDGRLDCDTVIGAELMAHQSFT